MFKSIKEFIFGKPAEAPVLEIAPYKVPEPVTPPTVEAELPLVQLEQVSSPAPETAKKPAPVKKAPAKTAKSAAKAAPKKAGRKPKAK